MNNNQFRRLVSDTPKAQNGEGSTSKVGATPSALGAKKSSFMPMTPRTVKGGADVDFARQVRERNAAQQPTRKFKSSAPKGVTYGAGYTDRAKARAEAEEEGGEDDKASRIQALEEQMKLGQISNETFEALRNQITGGDISNTHLVKGLDRQLLERVRRGEDVLGGGGDQGTSEPPLDVDDELDKLGEQEVEVVKREKTEKKGSMAPPPPPVAGVKRSRDEIMAELKAQRKQAAEAKAAPVFDSRWKQVGQKGNSRIERDHKGREVLITVDGDGNVKRKVRKATAEKPAPEMPDSSKPVLGADAAMPELQPQNLENEEEEDIFAGAGTEYNPLGNDDDEDSDSDSGDGEADRPKPKLPQDSDTTKPRDSEPDIADLDVPLTNQATTAPRNYFKDMPSTDTEPNKDRLAGVQDLLKKAAKMDATRDEHSEDNGDENDKDREARLKKRAQMLAQQDRDLDDMDMGFGSSRYDDGEEEGGEGKKAKLSEWKGSRQDGGDDGWQDGGGRDKKKRKPKKRKGDVNNAADIMRVIEGRRGNAEK